MAYLKNIPLLIFVLAFTSVHAQNKSPYAEIGKNVPLLTLSKGKYIETFDDDSLQRVGSVVMNIYTKKIVAFVVKDSLYHEPDVVSRWWGVDPHAAKYPSTSPYVFCNDNPIIFVDKDGRDAILIVFPDYKISTPLGKIDGLGHAGVLLIDNKTGVTKYYEYGRYDKDGKGLVRNVPISNVVLGKDGKPTVESLNKVLSQISQKSGQGGKIDGAYIISDQFDAMNQYAKDKQSENSDPNRTPYSLMGNNCGTFAADCINQDKTVDQPHISNPTPTNIVDEYQEEGNSKVTYDPKAKTTTIGKGDESDAKVEPKK